MGDCLRAGKPSHFVTSHPGQLSFPSLRIVKRVPATAGKAKAGSSVLRIERVGVQVKLSDPWKTRAIPQRF